MPIELPDLDDKTYAELMREARAAIPALYPGWSDHNPSDPGITLVELLAWLTELLIYRTGQLPEHNVRTFLRLLRGARPEGTPVGEATRSTMRTLRERWRAVTTEDYEYLTRYQWPESPEATTEPPQRPGEPPPPVEPPLLLWERHLARVRCLAGCDLSGDPLQSAPGHMSLVVVPGKSPLGSPWDAPRPKLLDALTRFFRERKLIGTRLHVTGPTYVPLTLSATLYLRDDARATDVKAEAPQVLARYFDPHVGGRDGKGWPFGRDVQASEVYATLDGLRGVEFVKKVSLARLETPTSKVSVIPLAPHELPRVEAARIQLTYMERRRDQWIEIP